MFINDIFKKKLNETVLDPRDPQGDYDAKRKVLHDLSLDPQVDQQAVQQRRLDLDREAKAKGLKEQDIEEAGPFSYGAKKPRRGSVADLAAKKRQEQEKGKQPVEPKDQRVGVARVTKDVAEGVTSPEIKQAYDAIMKTAPKSPERKRAIKHYQQLRADALDKKKEQGVAEGAGEKLLGKIIPGGASVFNAADAVRRFRSGDTVGAGIAAAGTIPITAIPAAAADLARDKYYTGSWLPSDEQRDLANLNRQVADMEKKNWKTLPDGSERSPDGQTIRGTVTKLSAEPQSKPVPGSMKPDSAELPSKSYPDDAQSVKEGSAQEKLYKRHQELRKKSGLPDPDYYKELKATYDLPDAERYAKQKEIKQKYKVTNEEVPATNIVQRPDQTSTDDLDQLSKQMRATVPKTRVDTTKWTDEQRFLQDKKVGKFLGSSFDEWKQQQNRTTQSAMPTNEDRDRYIEELQRAGYEIVTEKRMTCPECGGAAYSDQMLAEKQDACYHKVKSRYKVWPSAYASGALVRCRKKGAKNWGNKSKK